MTGGHGSLEALDEQLLASIFFHIGPKDVASVRSVSRDWEKVVDGAQVIGNYFCCTSTPLTLQVS
jgi:hypothetical protein